LSVLKRRRFRLVQCCDPEPRRVPGCAADNRDFHDHALAPDLHGSPFCGEDRPEEDAAVFSPMVAFGAMQADS
jgi:hypothetical protein